MKKKIKQISEWFNEFFSTCPFKKNFRKSDPPLLIIGHRGSPAMEPENTIPSFEQAIKEGANGLEIDLCITKDKQVVIWHDWNPNDTVAILRESGFEPFIKYKPHPPELGSEFRRKINLLTLEELREHYRYKVRHKKEMFPVNVHIPTLRDFFEWTQKQPNLKVVCLDIKTPDEEAELSVEILCSVKEMIEQYKPKFLVIIESPSKAIHKVMKEHYPNLNYCLDIEAPPGIILEPILYSAVTAAMNNGYSYAITLRPRKITIGNFTTFRRIIMHDIKVTRTLRSIGPEKNIKYLIAATVSKEKELKCLVRLGVEGIQTDFPARLKRIAYKYKRHVL